MSAAATCIRLAVVVACVISMAAGTGGQEVRYRKNVKAMTPAEWTALELAIGALHKNDSNNPRTLSSAERLDSYAYFVKRHHEESIHYGELIWPWHRAFLLQFEDALNKVRPPADPVIALPYWDWTEPSDGHIGYPSAYERTGSVLHISERSSHPPAAADETPFCVGSGHSCDPSQPNSAARFMQDVLGTNDWLHFGGGQRGRDAEVDLNMAVHLVIHDQYVQGTMGPASTAARDPLFWAHHANLDRLVSNWQAARKGTDACGACGTLVYVDPAAGGRFTVKSLLNNDALPRGKHAQVKVVYVQPPSGSGPVRTPARSAVPASLQAVDMTLAGELTQFGFTLPAPSGATLTLKMTHVKVPTEHSYVVDVFVFPAAVIFQKNDEFTRTYLAGRFALMAEDHARSGGRGAGGRAGVDERGIIVTTELGNAFAAIAGSTDAREYRLAILIRPSENIEFNKMADEVKVSGIELLQRKGDSTERILLKR